MMEALYRNPEAAELAFYRAFEAADLDAMMAVWAPDDDIVCVHPLAPPNRGVAAVRASWQEIFQATATLSFDIRALAVRHQDQTCVRVVEERIRVGSQALARGPMVATNVYRLTGAGWRMVLHHASPTRRPAGPPRPTPSLH
jgi:ketosteroid isomerase-like protein